MTNQEYNQASEALLAWLRSQQIIDRNAVIVLSQTMATLIKRNFDEQGQNVMLKQLYILLESEMLR